MPRSTQSNTRWLQAHPRAVAARRLPCQQQARRSPVSRERPADHSPSSQTAGHAREPAALSARVVVDVFTRECLAIEPGQHLGGTEVVNVLRRIAGVRRAPKRIYWDNESEASGHLVDLRACANGVVMEFSRPGKPTDRYLNRVVQWHAPGRMPEPARV